MIPLAKWKNPLLLLLGIGVSNLGGWIYLIALNLIVLDMTGSPLAVSILYILIPVAALCTNFWAGSYIDRLNKRKVMIGLDLIRALFIFFLPMMDSLLLIYIGVFIVNSAGAIFAPASMVYMTKLVPQGRRQRFNALRNFINSSGFILGPTIAGMLFMIGSPAMAIQLNSMALCLSAVVLFFLPDLENDEKPAARRKVGAHLIKQDWKEILSFSRSNRHLTVVYVLFSMLTVCMTGLDSLEASFATRVLSLSESSYGFLVSIAGFGIIVGSLINVLIAGRVPTNILIGVGAVFTPVGYIVFAFSQTFLWAAAGFFILTFALSFANIGFFTFYQHHVPVSIMGRFSSLFGMLEAVLVIGFTAAIGISAELFGIQFIYRLSSVAFLLLGFLIILVVLDRTKASYYEQDFMEIPPIKR